MPKLKRKKKKLLVGPIIIGAEFNRKNHNPISHDCDWKKTEITRC
jgi:hypothetical protein